jgi:hypothetical protein
LLHIFEHLPHLGKLIVGRCLAADAESKKEREDAGIRSTERHVAKESGKEENSHDLGAALVTGKISKCESVNGNIHFQISARNNVYDQLTY